VGQGPPGNLSLPAVTMAGWIPSAEAASAVGMGLGSPEAKLAHAGGFLASKVQDEVITCVGDCSGARAGTDN